MQKGCTMDQIFPSVYAYNDFRKFLSDYQESRMQFEPTFTKSEFSRMMNLPNTRSYFTDVLKGKRVTETFIERFIKVLGFKENEAQFFRTLIRFNQAENVVERELAFQQLIDLNKTPSKTLDKNMVEYYSRWYYGVIRALVEIETFSDDYADLAKKIRPPITPGQVKKAVKLLIKLGLAERNELGILKPTYKAIKAPEIFHDEFIRQYQLQILSLVQQKMISEPSDIGFSYMSTISISEQGYHRLLRLVEKLQSQARSTVHKDENAANRVVHLSVILTKLTKGE